MTGSATPTKQPIDKAYSIASIKACIPTPLDLDKLNYNSWSALFKRFCKTYDVQHHLDAPPSPSTPITTVTNDPFHDTNDSLVVMWMYSTISQKLVDMVIDDSTTAHEVWKRLKDIFHDNKEARVIQIDNEIRNMNIGNLSVTDYFQGIKNKSDRLANLGSPVSDSSLVTYAINGLRSRFPEMARIIRHRENPATFDVVRSMVLLEESEMAAANHTPSLLAQPTLPNVLVATTPIVNQSNTMSSSSIEPCRNFRRGNCTYGSRCRFVHGLNDNRPRPQNNTHSDVATSKHNSRSYATTTGHASHNQDKQAPNFTNPSQAQENIRYVYIQSGAANPHNGTQFMPTPRTFPVQHVVTPAQQAHLATPQPGPLQQSTGPIPQQPPHPAIYPWAQYSVLGSQLGTTIPPGASFPSQATLLPQAFQTMTMQDPSWNMDTGASSHLADNTGLPDPQAPSPL